mmetsp:Transcript_35033/g.100883  ORF Transcript_35033/g.100883 Transcript_35033/m.100883 type:complete len:206 (-) Transcript_35033:330-947(-)
MSSRSRSWNSPSRAVTCAPWLFNCASCRIHWSSARSRKAFSMSSQRAAGAGAGNGGAPQGVSARPSSPGDGGSKVKLLKAKRSTTESVWDIAIECFRDRGLATSTECLRLIGVLSKLSDTFRHGARSQNPESDTSDVKRDLSLRLVLPGMPAMRPKASSFASSFSVACSIACMASSPPTRSEMTASWSCTCSSFVDILQILKFTS